MHRPDSRNLFLLAIGVAAGLALGPYGLAWVAPSFYQRHFVGAAEAQTKLEAFDGQIRERRARLASTGATEAALEQLDRQEQNDPRRALLEARLQLARREHADRFIGWSTTIIAAVVVMMVIEVLATRAGVQRNLATARYALLAVWTAIALAVPSLMHGLQVVFGLLLIVVVLLAALVPLGGGRVEE